MTLEDALSQYVRNRSITVHLGEGNVSASDTETESATDINVSRLSSEIGQIARNNALYFRACFVSLVLLFVGCIALVFNFLNEPSKAGAVFGVTGLSFLGVIAQMLKLWKQKVASDFTLALAGSLPAQQLLTALETILKQLRA